MIRLYTAHYHPVIGRLPTLIVFLLAVGAGEVAAQPGRGRLDRLGQYLADGIDD
jgi:hypothetical protein